MLGTILWSSVRAVCALELFLQLLLKYFVTMTALKSPFLRIPISDHLSFGVVWCNLTKKPSLFDTLAITERSPLSNAILVACLGYLRPLLVKEKEFPTLVPGALEVGTEDLSACGRMWIRNTF